LLFYDFVIGFYELVPFYRDLVGFAYTSFVFFSSALDIAAFFECVQQWI
jgi:hypothetical protein